MTHQVVTRVREILPADLPRVRPLDGPERVANAQELLDMLGIVATDEPNIYVSREQERKERGSRQFRPMVALPGVVLAQGFSAKEVYGRLTPEMRARVLRARVFRSTEPDRRPDLRAHFAAVMERAGIPGSEREQLTRDRARRDAQNPLIAVEERVLPMKDRLESDVVDESDIPPARFAGERDR